MEQKLDFSILKTLTQLPGVSGREQAVRAQVQAYLSGAVDEIRTDALGNLIVTKKGTSGQAVLLCAHLDEVGLMVQHIDPSGFLRFITVGGIDSRTLLAQRVRLQTKAGELPGIIGTKPAHITTEADRAKAIPTKDLFIDVGLPPEQVRAQVSVGDVAVLDRPYLEFGDEMVSAKALDNRVGVFVLAELLKKLKNPLHTVYGVFSVQEEVGARGAKTAAFGLEADVCLTLDTTGAGDIPGVEPQQQIVAVGAGVGITALDACTITPKPLLDGLTACCQEHQIPFQIRVAPRGGTDAGSVHVSKTGIASCPLSIPTRNIHSNVEVLSKKDVRALFDLVVCLMQSPLVYE